MTFRKNTGIPAENAAKTHCPQGHPYSVENTYFNRGKRFCKTCNRKRALAWWHSKRKSRTG